LLDANNVKKIKIGAMNKLKYCQQYNLYKSQLKGAEGTARFNSGKYLLQMIKYHV
jgi:hypothetical protein